ncbi:adenine deaminase C-terminal domain-containing protein [Kroppenstedtia eburnea]|uniref:adenine deaminase C-terminal domain-containing protein n=1 Tax=Kroppenstedtia eburnea TaxID=714067 RepID=UPI00363382FB
MTNRIRRQDLERLIQTATGKLLPTRVLVGGRVLNVFTGELELADVALCGERIAYVGDLKNGGLQLPDSRRIIDVTDKVLVPGYIEPHAHPFQLYHPVTLAAEVLKGGTTTLINDNLFFFTRMDPDHWSRLLEELDRLPVKMLWWARLDAQAHLSEESRFLFGGDRVSGELKRPSVVQAGELTDWTPLLEGEESRTRWVGEVRERGIRVEGHAPGASFRTLSRLAAAGVTGDHESISAGEVLDRLRLGYMTTLRHSSLRPDLPKLIKGLLQWKGEIPWHRLMLTTDGPTPPYLGRGFVDHALKTAMEAGCPPVRAYQMVTLNPAGYYRLDEHLGAIAPGRIADINILSSLEEPVPELVVADGEPVADRRSLLCSFPEVDWAGYPTLNRRWRGWVRPEHLNELPRARGGKIPVLRLLNPVITKLEWRESPEGTRPNLPLDGEDLLVALADRDGKWITKALVRGFGRNIDGLVSTYNGSEDLLLVGRNPAAMARAANRALEQGGAITWVQNGEEVYNLPLPLAGKTSLLPLSELIPRTEEFLRRMKEHEHPFHDPVYTFLFLSSTHLPQVRLTADGLMQIKEKKVLVPAERLN